MIRFIWIFTKNKTLRQNSIGLLCQSKIYVISCNFIIFHIKQNEPFLSNDLSNSKNKMEWIGMQVKLWWNSWKLKS
jgi:hypothetical protein